MAASRCRLRAGGASACNGRSLGGRSRVDFFRTLGWRPSRRRRNFLSGRSDEKEGCVRQRTAKRKLTRACDWTLVVYSMRSLRLAELLRAYFQAMFIVVVPRQHGSGCGGRAPQPHSVALHIVLFETAGGYCQCRGKSACSALSQSVRALLCAFLHLAVTRLPAAGYPSATRLPYLLKNSRANQCSACHERGK